MERIYSILCIVLCMAMLLCSCKKGISGPTSSELMQKYGNVYPKAQIWITQEDEDMFMNCQHFNYYYAQSNGQAEFVFPNAGLEKEEIRKKLATEIMANKAPDLILSTDGDLFPDINKSASTGAFASWDTLLDVLDDDTVIYRNVLEGALATDGKVYALPLTYDLDVIVTTKANMEQYGFDRTDFSDFYQATATLKRLWEQADGAYPVHMRSPSFCRSMPGILNYETKQTALRSEAIQQLLSDWSWIYKQHQNFEYVSTPYSDMSFWEHQVLEISSTNEAILALGRMTVEDREQLVVIPLCDTEGKISGRIQSYALLPAQCQQPEIVKNYMTSLLKDVDGQSISSMNLSRKYTEHLLNMQELQTTNSEYISEDMVAMMEQPMRLCVDRSDIWRYDNQILTMTLKENPDWEDLETDINIYLSE